MEYFVAGTVVGALCAAVGKFKDYEGNTIANQIQQIRYCPVLSSSNMPTSDEEPNFFKFVGATSALPNDTVRYL
jgi:hypothetical protein